MLEDLVSAVRTKQAILFAGAGVSMTVGLPSWSTLIEHIADELRIDLSDFKDMDLNYLTLAEYYRLKQGSIGPLRSWMDRNWTIPEDTLKKSRVHELICKLDFPILYTTNFDRNLETAYDLHGKEYVKIVNAKDIARVREGVPQIVKYHGDFDDDGSIVIAETDYLERLSFESPLDIKFRSDSLGKTILFIGYSMTDLNIRFLMHRQSYVFMLRANPVEQAVLEQWGLQVLMEKECPPEKALEKFLTKLSKAVEKDEDSV
ncbi:MAG: Sir2 family NAD-dependent protein deacetylase [Microvirga sp.]|nr:Sir2 family NAD-dependent protein deacetylase [Microvirga sp.]